MELQINKRKYSGFERITINRQNDAILDSFAIIINTENINNTPFKPLGYEQVVILHNNEVLLTGVAENLVFEKNSNRSYITVTGRSKGGSYIDSTPAGALEWEVVDIKTIAQDLAVGHNVSIQSNELIRMERTSIGVNETIGSFLTRTALAMGVYIRSNPQGAIVISSANTLQRSDYDFSNKTSGIMNIKMVCNGSERYSNLYLSRVDEEGNIDNGIAREQLYETRDTTIIGDTFIPDAQGAAEWALQRLQHLSFTINIDIDSISTPAGKIYSDGDIAIVQFPELGISARTLCQKATLTEASDGQIATIELSVLK